MLKKATKTETTTELSTFTFELEPYDRHDIPPSFDIRTVVFSDQPDDPWFVAADVCKALGYYVKPDGSVNTSNATRLLAQDEFATAVISGKSRGNGTRQMKVKIISESGLYKLTMRSDKPEAKQFQDWVARDVLPSIRKHGGYIQGQETGKLSDAELLAKAVLVAQRVNEELSQKNAMLTEDLTRKQFVIEEMHDQVGALAEDNAALEAVKAEMEPLVEGFQHFLSLDGTYNKEAVAKILGFPSAIMLNRWLAYVGIQSARKYWKNGREYIKYWYLRSQWVKRHDLFKTKTSEDVVRGTQVHIQGTIALLETQQPSKH